jgi:hypothetical protein
MRLADFLDANVEPILRDEWELFAADLLPAGKRLDSLALRAHAGEIVRAIAEDLRAPQTTLQQDLKARGWHHRMLPSPHRRSNTHHAASH